MYNLKEFANRTHLVQALPCYIVELGPARAASSVLIMSGQKRDRSCAPTKNDPKAIETGHMPAVKTTPMYYAEVERMSAAETGQMSAVETRQMCSIETGLWPAAVPSSVETG